MSLTSKEIKETLIQLADFFHSEKNIFQKFVIIHKYIDFLNKTSLTKEALQKIFDDSAATMGDIYENLSNKAERDKVRSKKFWLYYSDLEMIHDVMGNFKNCKTAERKEFDILCWDFSEPYSEEILELAFKVVNCHVFNRLDQESFLSEHKKDGQTWFDEKKSILYVNDFKIMIAKQDKETNAHKILKYIFKDNIDNLSDNFFFSEMAEDIFEDLEYKQDQNSWKRYYRSCELINEKVLKETKKSVDNFIIFNSGKTGYLKINPKFR